MIKTFITEELTPETRARIVDICVAAHDEGEFRFMFEKYFVSGCIHTLGYVDDEIVAHAVVSTRGAQPGGLPILKTAYVDAVSTHPDFQHRGIGSAVMRSLAESASDHEMGCLGTDLDGYYEQFGWEEWRGELGGRNDDGTVIPTPDHERIMVLRLPNCPSLDLDGPMTIEWQVQRFW